MLLRKVDLAMIWLRHEDEAGGCQVSGRLNFRRDGKGVAGAGPPSAGFVDLAA